MKKSLDPKYSELIAKPAFADPRPHKARYKRSGRGVSNTKQGKNLVEKMKKLGF